jgi:Zn-dependent protease with chaperone function
MLAGSPAWQAETRAVVKELVANLQADYQSRVASVPIVFDPTSDVNAYATCDKNNAPIVVGTEGLLDAADAIAETKATDELFGTHTYDAYAAAVTPGLASQQGGSALLPANIIPPQYWLDQRRVTRAHQIFDETVAFTFGHELSHHYLGHTGCAMGAASIFAQTLAQLGQIITSGAPPMNQPNEAWADTYGCRNTLDTGLARSRVAYRWTEAGGLYLLDFFDRLMTASGASPFVSILLSHPAPQLRIQLVHTTAATWHLQHPGY